MKQFLTTLLVIVAIQQTRAQVSGTVFRDYNASGVKENTSTYNEPFVSGITVNAYNSAGSLVGTQLTNASGAYSFTGLTLPLRIEFTGILSEDRSSSVGSSNLSSVQFYSSPTTTANYAVNYSQHYTSTTNPYYVVSQFEANRPPSSEPLATAMLKQQYNTRGGSSFAPSIAHTSQIGGTWAVVYDRQRSLIYTSAFAKRHASMKDNDADGKEDLGAIYSMTASGSPSLWLDLSTLGIDFGTSLLPTIASRALPATLTGPCHDAAMFALVGKIGIGSITLSDDYTKMYVMNLYDKKIYTIDIASKTLLATSVVVPSSCTSGNSRPFALKYHRGKVYVGSICDAATSGNYNDLTATVLSYDGSSFTTVLSYPLNYVKGYVFKDLDDNNSNSLQEEWGKQWNAWSDVMPTSIFTSYLTSPASQVVLNPQPMLVDLEFDYDESLIMIFNDRFGHQAGQVNYGTNVNNTSNFYTGLAAGDILRASYSGGTYTLENDGVVGGLTGNTTNLNGPGGGEFYHGDHDQYFYHQENVIGGSLFYPGKREVAAVVTDPVGYWAGGVYFFDNINGDVVNGTDNYQLYPSTLDNTKFGKVNGLGDMELISDGAPIEIGNRVWLDTDGDGIQDAGENGIANVTILLFQGLTQVGTTTTDANGNYYFKNSNVTGGVLPNTAYEIRLSTTQGAVASYYLTSANTDGSSNGDERDSDGIGSTTAIISLVTGSYGSNNHSYDFGFSITPPCIKPDAGSNTTACSGTCINLTGTSPTTGTWSTQSGNPSGATLGSTIGGVAEVCFASNATGTYNFIYNIGASCEDTMSVVVGTPPTADAGSTQNLNCTTTSATIGTTAIVGNTYSWSPATGLSATNIAQPTASPAATTTYTVTVTGSNGCTATASVTVNVNTVAPTADAGSTQNLNCTTTSATIGTTAIVGNTYSWSPATGLSATNIAQPTASPAATTTYTVTVTGSNGCTATASVTVNVNTTAPTANAGSTQNLDCTTTSATIGTTAIAGNTYSWSPATGLSATNIAQPTASPTVTTTYTVTVTGSNGCTATASVTVNVNTTSPTADAGSTQNLNCTTTSATIGTTAIAGNTYSWSPATGLSATNIAQPTASPTVTTTYTVTVTGSNGCTATASVTVNVNTTAPTADAGSTQNLDCTTTSATIGTTAIAGNTYSWSPATGLSASNIAQPIASPTATTVYTVTVTGSNGCISASSVTVTVDNSPPPYAYAGASKYITCIYSSDYIGPSDWPGNQYSWSPTNNLSNPLVAQPTVSGLTTTTTYTLTVTGSNGCVAVDSVTVFVDLVPPVSDAGPDKEINCSTSTVNIGSNSLPNNVMYSWNPTSGLSDPNSPNPVATPSTTTTYVVTSMGMINGCTSQDTVTVTVNTVPPAVTISGGTIVCNGSTTTLTASGANTYVWSNTDISASTTVGVGTYTVTGTASNGCTSTTSVEITNQQGSVGNYVWSDLNNNGTNDEVPSAGINGVTVELWNATTNTLVSSTTTANDGGGNPGYYNFTVCTSGDYKVKFPVTNGGKNLTTQTTTAATDNNSDASTVDGFSPTFTINTSGSGTDKDNPTIDAGYQAPKACLGNYVWNDLNQNGIQDGSEVGVSGVTTTLYDANTNTILAIVTTDAYGFYQFCALNPGDYKVGFTLPANYVYTTGNNGNDELDSDANPISGLTGTYTLASGDSNMTVDAGIYQPQPTTASVGDRVWFDANNNGLQDPGEQGVSGVTVMLYNCGNLNAPLAATVTDANGLYIFENLQAGSYQIVFSAPIGTVFTNTGATISGANNSDADGSGLTGCFTVAAGDAITYVDAGIVLQNTANSSLGDRVWNDANQNGIQDPNETGVGGVNVDLYDASGTTIIGSTTTDALGNYQFSDLAPGCYVVGFALPAGYTRTTAGAGTDSSKNSDANVGTGMTGQICLSAGQNNPTIDAGIYNASNTNSIGDRVWYDANQNGLQDGPEYGYPGVVVTLYACITNTIVATTTTNSNGNYLFDGLANGDYYVGFGFIPGYQFTSANSDAAGVLSANNSDANPSSGLTACVTLSGNTHITTVDAGIYEGNGRTATSSLGDLVWVDANNNGLQDAGEPGVSGVTATLINANTNATLASTITDGLGNYIFTNLTGGLYRVEFSNIPAGYTFTTQSGSIEDELNSDANATTGVTADIPLGLGEDKMSVDAGIVPPSSTVCLGDYVWFDFNNNGVQEGNETPVPGVTVKLYDNNTNTVLQVTTTNRQGKYLFCGLSNGNTYSVGFENLPAGYGFTVSNGALSVTDNSDANPATGRTTTVTLGSADDLTLDAGIYSTTTAVVGNYVWYDEDADGIQDPTEAPIPGVLVTLYDNTNTPVSSAVTDANGGYLFTNVTPGNYVIGFSGYPGSLVPTSKGSNASADDDSNIDPNTGLTDVFTVTPGSSNLTLDAGYKANPVAGLGNYVWHDVNKNGLQDPSEAPIAGVVVTLYGSDGTTPLGTAITDGNGAYSFPNLTAGSYIVGFGNIPLGFTRTQIVGGLNDALNSDIDASNKTALINLAGGTYNPNIDAGFYFGFPLGAQQLVATMVKQQGTKQAVVYWFTQDEENTAMFEIQRSNNGSDFITVGTKPASGHTEGQTSYMALDDISSLEQGVVIYYRIKLIDIDAQQKYSNTVSLKVGASTNAEVVVHPIPFTNRLSIAYLAESNETIKMELLDMSGRIVASREQEVSKGVNHVELDNLERLSSSQYLLRIIPSGAGETHVIRVAK